MRNTRWVASPSPLTADPGAEVTGRVVAENDGIHALVLLAAAREDLLRVFRGRPAAGAVGTGAVGLPDALAAGFGVTLREPLSPFDGTLDVERRERAIGGLGCR